MQPDLSINIETQPTPSGFMKWCSDTKNKIETFWNGRKVVEMRQGWLFKASMAFLSLSAIALIITVLVLGIMAVATIAPTLAVIAFTAVKWCVVLAGISLAITLIWAGIKLLFDLIRQKIHDFLNKPKNEEVSLINGSP